MEMNHTQLFLGNHKNETVDFQQKIQMYQEKPQCETLFLFEGISWLDNSSELCYC